MIIVILALEKVTCMSYVYYILIVLLQGIVACRNSTNTWYQYYYYYVQVLTAGSISENYITYYIWWCWGLNSGSWRWIYRWSSEIVYNSSTVNNTLSMLTQKRKFTLTCKLSWNSLMWHQFTKYTKPTWCIANRWVSKRKISTKTQIFYYSGSATEFKSNKMNKAMGKLYYYNLLLQKTLL